MTNPSLPLIDSWIQHPSPQFVMDPMFTSLRRWLGVTEAPTELPLDFTVSALESAGVSRALLTAWWGPQGALISNDEVAACVRERPDLLVGIGAVDLSRPVPAVHELRRCVNELGFRGLRFLPWLWGLPPNDRRYYPLYAECVELGIPCCFQMGHAGPLRASDPGRPVPYLDEVALDFPELTIVGGHIGYPWTDEMISLATKYDNVYIDTSAYKPRRFPPQFAEFLRGHGRKKVLFASDFPLVQPAACLAQLDELELGDEARQLYLSENAQRVFGLDP